MIRRRRSGSAGAVDAADGAGAAGDGRRREDTETSREVRRLWWALAGVVGEANAEGARLPPGAVPTVRDVDDVLRPLLEHLEIHPPNGEELRGLIAIIDDYLPQALRDYLALPARYAERPGPTGTSPADDLVRQLVLLDEGANELADLVYTGDAARLAVQARFLDAKFRRSDLDLE
ncbi:hypothetical protein I6A84_27255 [Frankia sp. CNm7]|uniref:Uncharacterized protein n=1 Tax=Frankia nepalensis TaxID=1836974 RepID=A0A937ULQ1_9ACTN|nr:hypothetical protein [Frankia nepalensis]MBL7495455.1 hypothetical protein [Frankia nepalensis]MBL7510714.1 hypothetical protein [Frankia nepalensis]MBL7521677.1 hypothetical protein [Frankia nepalensis]MBL7626012.1 hypothetical protein [Frankia nepalensis]